MGKEQLVWTGSKKATNFVLALLNEAIAAFVNLTSKLSEDVKGTLYLQTLEGRNINIIKRGSKPFLSL